MADSAVRVRSRRRVRRTGQRLQLTAVMVRDRFGYVASYPAALRCGYLSDSEANELDGYYEQILSQLVRMIEHPDDWTVGAHHRPRVPGSPRQFPVPASPCLTMGHRRETP